jgi:hypothetical protein
MAKGSQNRDSGLAYHHAVNSIGKKRKCIGIFHKGYPKGELVESSLFKRQGTGYQAFCSDCDQARQNLQKTLKRLAAIILANKKYRIKLLSDFREQEKLINSKIDTVVKSVSKDIDVYTHLVVGKKKFTIKELKLYENNMSVERKKSLIANINDIVRNSQNDLLVRKKVKKIGEDFTCMCSMCKSFLSVLNVNSNISQSRDVFDLNNKPTGYKLPLHNICEQCSTGSRAEAIRHYKYLCSGNFIKASKEMTLIGKRYKSKDIDADHILPLRLGGKHDPLNIRPFPKKKNIEKRDNLTSEVISFIEEKKIPFKTLLSDWYHTAYDSVKKENIKVVESALRFAVDQKRSGIRNLSRKKQKEELLKLYPTLSNKELERIIRKCFA